MKLALFVRPGDTVARPGILGERGVIDISSAVARRDNAQLCMQDLIERYDTLAPLLQHMERHAPAVVPERVRLLSPLPRPGKIVQCAPVRGPPGNGEGRPLNFMLKNAAAVIGPGDVIDLLAFSESWNFMHSAELALVMKSIDHVENSGWRNAVFGYTCLIDVTGRSEWATTRHQGRRRDRSFDMYLPLGPCIVTADSIADPTHLQVLCWNNGKLRDAGGMPHDIPSIVAATSAAMSFSAGDIIACGSHRDAGARLEHGARVRIAIEGIGDMSLTVHGPLPAVRPAVRTVAAATHRQLPGPADRRRCHG